MISSIILPFIILPVPGFAGSRSVVECVGQALARHRFRVPEGARRPEPWSGDDSSPLKGACGATTRRHSSSYLRRFDAQVWLKVRRWCHSWLPLSPCTESFSVRLPHCFSRSAPRSFSSRLGGGFGTVTHGIDPPAPLQSLIFVAQQRHRRVKRHP